MTQPKPSHDIPAGFRPVAFAARPEIRRSNFLVDTGDIDTNQYHLTNGELAWVHGPLSIESELAWQSLEETAGSYSRSS